MFSSKKKRENVESLEWSGTLSQSCIVPRIFKGNLDEPILHRIDQQEHVWIHSPNIDSEHYQPKQHVELV